MIYGTIYSWNCSAGIYYGSSVNEKNRKSNHKSDAKFRPMQCHKIFNEIGWDKVEYKILEQDEFESVAKLRQREQYYISSHNGDIKCLNVKKAYVLYMQQQQSLYDYIVALELADPKKFAQDKDKLYERLNWTEEESKADAKRRSQEYKERQKLKNAEEIILPINL